MLAWKKAKSHKCKNPVFQIHVFPKWIHAASRKGMFCRCSHHHSSYVYTISLKHDCRIHVQGIRHTAGRTKTRWPQRHFAVSHLCPGVDGMRLHLNLITRHHALRLPSASLVPPPPSEIDGEWPQYDLVSLARDRSPPAQAVCNKVGSSIAARGLLSMPC